MTRARDLSNLIGSGNYVSETLTATAGQTAFTVTDGYTPNFVQVFMNGLLLDPVVDYAATTSPTITLTTGANAGDELEVVKYNTFSVGDAITQTAADTRYVNAAGDTMTGGLNVTGGNVGVGTSSPSTYNAQLVNYKDTGSGTYLGHVNGSGTFPKVSAIGMGSDAVSFTHTSGGATYALFGSAQIAAIQSAASGAPTDLAFYTNASGTVTERMRIDNAGRVTMPYQPSFHAGVTSSQTYSSGSTVVFQTAYHNTGNHFNTSTGVFTAPVAGFYSFTVKMLHQGVTNGFSVDSAVIKNSVSSSGYAFQMQRHKYQADYTGHTGYLWEGTSCQIYLSANDTFKVRYAGAQSSLIHANPNWSYFCGHLIG